MRNVDCVSHPCRHYQRLFNLAVPESSLGGMAQGQIYPPQILPGLHSFARDVGGLTSIHVTRSRTSSDWPWFIDIQATWSDREAPTGVLLRIYWKQRRSDVPTHHLSVGDRESLLVNRRISLGDLGFGVFAAEIEEDRLRAISVLMALYEDALSIRNAYIDISEDYVVARLDAAAQKRTRPSTAFQKQRAGRMPPEEDDV